jgi:hypothetical protein
LLSFSQFAGRDFAGGFSTYLLAMTETVAKSTGGAGTGRDVYELHTGKVMAFLGLVSYASLFCTLPLRKVRNKFNHFQRRNDQYLIDVFGYHLLGSSQNSQHFFVIIMSLLSNLKISRHCLAAHDTGLQADVSKWFSYRRDRQQLPYTGGSGDSKVNNHAICKLFGQKLLVLYHSISKLNRHHLFSLFLSLDCKCSL